MKFKSIKIRNFRNFENANVSIDNRNVFFGFNDVGKTNFLFAIRFLLDWSIRKDGFKITDFHKLNDNNEILILLELDISDMATNTDTQKLVAKAGRVLQSNQNSLYISAKSKKEDGLYAIELSWGGDENSLEKIVSNGQKNEIDRLFDVHYIDSQTDLDYVFRKAVSMKNVLSRKDDDDTELKNKLSALNSEIESLSGIYNFKGSLNSELHKYDSSITLRLSSREISIDPYKTIAPYIQKDETGDLYNLSGDGLRKLTSYSLYKLIALKTKGTKITIFIVEEPENHLHKTTLLKLSQVLFNENEFPYLFLSTHSAELLSEMDKINIVRIAHENELKTHSHFYIVPPEYSKVRKLLNSNLTQALFYNSVLLVEGFSEVALFDAVLTNKFKCNYKIKGIDILPVSGIAFKEYIKVLIPLHIKVFVKTDNDAYIKNCNNGTKSHTTLGLNRIKELGVYISNIRNDEVKRTAYERIDIIESVPFTQEALFAENKALIDLCRTDNIYLSHIDLENDLASCLQERFANLLQQKDIDSAVEYLQKKKVYYMVELIEKMNDADFNTIFNDVYFDVLGGFYNGILR